MLFLVVGWWIAILITSITQCQPYNYFWKQYVDPTAVGHCINIPNFFVGNAAASVATDFMILLTPIPMVWGLQMPIAQRLSVLGIFFLGGLYVTVSIIFGASANDIITSQCVRRRNCSHCCFARNVQISRPYLEYVSSIYLVFRRAQHWYRLCLFTYSSTSTSTMHTRLVRG